MHALETIIVPKITPQAPAERLVDLLLRPNFSGSLAPSAHAATKTLAIVIAVALGCQDVSQKLVFDQTDHCRCVMPPFILQTVVVRTVVHLEDC